MSVLRLNHFTAKDGCEEELKEKLTAILPILQNAAGNLSCKLVVESDKPANIVIIEEWQDVEAHKASLATVPPETFAPVMALLAGSPTGAYYS